MATVIFGIEPAELVHNTLTIPVSPAAPIRGALLHPGARVLLGRMQGGRRWTILATASIAGQWSDENARNLVITDVARCSPVPIMSSADPTSPGGDFRFFAVLESDMPAAPESARQYQQDENPNLLEAAEAGPELPLKESNPRFKDDEGEQETEG